MSTRIKEITSEEFEQSAARGAAKLKKLHEHPDKQDFDNHNKITIMIAPPNLNARQIKNRVDIVSYMFKVGE